MTPLPSSYGVTARGSSIFSETVQITRLIQIIVV